MAAATALKPPLGHIDILAMREANLRAAGGGGSSPSAVARSLWEKIGKRETLRH